MNDKTTKSESKGGTADTTKKVVQPVVASSTTPVSAKVAATTSEDKPVETAAKVAQKAATKTAKKTRKTVKRTTAKTAKVQKKAIKAAPKKVAPKNKKKEITMTNFDMNSWFGGYDLPTNDKVEELMANAGKQGEEMIAKSKAASEELAAMTKANVEAVIESTRIAANGAKEIGTKIIEDSRAQFETTSDNMRLLAEAKTPADFMTVQAELAKSSFDRMISEGSKLTEHMVKLAGDAMQPVSNRASVNAEKVKDLMA